MTSQRWRLTRDLFEQALEEQPADVDRWLRDRVPSDDSLRREIRSLLDHHARAGAFLVDPIAGRAADLLRDDAGLRPGARVGDYVVVREIGRGGMGCVYLARDERLGREVALKAVAPHVATTAAHRERLRQEARAAAALNHPGICTVYALIESGDDLFVASEYVNGCTLRDDIAAGRRPTPGDVLDGTHALADALAAAHRAGITHRDLKPENIMRTVDGRWKILDFGLARSSDRAFEGAGISLATLPGALVGTPAYMAPEQLSGQVAGPAADVFALGVVLYEWTTGVHPFAATTPLGVVARVLESHAEPIAPRAPALRPTVAAVIDRCLAKPAAARFASAVEIVDALARDDLTPRRPRTLTWWRVHQLAIMTLYVVASAVAWHAKETLVPGPLSLWMFIALAIAAAFGGIARGHLLFTEAMNRPRLGTERQRIASMLVRVDLAVAAVMFSDGLLIAPVRQLWAVFALALAIGIALAAVLMEPATTAAAFGDD